MGSNASHNLQNFLDDVDEKVLECTICFRRYTNPKILNCFHSYCLSCLKDWVKKNKGKLTCPSCTTSYPIPEGGLEKLPPNTFLNNLLDTIRQSSKSDQIKCFCGKEDTAKDYCQECRHYLCSACSDYHKKLPMSADHKLHSVEDVKQMSPIKFASLHPPLCLHHNKLLEFYCEECKAATCVNCTISSHPECNGSKQIDISQAFKTFKETSEELIKSAEQCKMKLQSQHNTVVQDATILEKSKGRSLEDIDKHVKELVKNITENGDKLKSEVEAIFKKKKDAIDVQTQEMENVISDIDKKASLLKHCLKMDGARAIESSGTVVTSLKDSINQLPVTEHDDNGQHDNRQIYFIKNKDITSKQQCDIGIVSHK